MNVDRHHDGGSGIRDEIVLELTGTRLLHALLERGLQGPESRQAEIHRALALDDREMWLRYALRHAEEGESPLSEARAMIGLRLARGIGEPETTVIWLWLACCVCGAPVTPAGCYDLLQLGRRLNGALSGVAGGARRDA